MKTILEEWSEKTNPMAYSEFLFSQNEDLRKEVRRLQKQLNEANRVIKRELRRKSPKGGVLLCDMNDYLEKWGVK